MYAANDRKPTITVTRGVVPSGAGGVPSFQKSSGSGLLLFGYFVVSGFHTRDCFLGQDGYKLQPAGRWTGQRKMGQRSFTNSLFKEGSNGWLTSVYILPACLSKAESFIYQTREEQRMLLLGLKPWVDEGWILGKEHSCSWSERVIFVSVWRFPVSNFLFPCLERWWSHWDASLPYTIHTFFGA